MGKVPDFGPISAMASLMANTDGSWAILILDVFEPRGAFFGPWLEQPPDFVWLTGPGELSVIAAMGVRQAPLTSPLMPAGMVGFLA